MTAPAKIRLLLALLFASLLFTAIVVQKTYTAQNNLDQTAQILENNLHKKEKFVTQFLGNPSNFNKLKTVKYNAANALSIIETFTTNESTWAFTTQKGELTFWSGIKVIPANPAAIKEGLTFIKESNGYYESIKKSSGDFSAIILIPVKINYPFENQYLKNNFQPGLLQQNNLEIADFTDKNVHAIHSLNHTYLFSVKVIDNRLNYSFLYFEDSLWIFSFLALCVLINNICSFIAGKGYVTVSIISLASFIALIRFINLYYGWPNFASDLLIFEPSVYGSSAIYPSFGDFCINVILITWLVAFIYYQRAKLSRYVPNKIAGYTIVVGCTSLLIIASTSLLNLFYGLVINSRINFDVNNVLNLSVYSICGVLMLCFAFLIFYLLNEVCLIICMKLTIPVVHQFLILFTLICVTTTITAFYREFTVFYFLWMILVLIRGYAYLNLQERLTSASFSGILIICALIASIKLNHFQSVKEKETRKALVQKLETPDDITADYFFKKIEKQIINDKPSIRFLSDTTRNIDYLKNYFQKTYFDGYLSKYDFQLYIFNNKGQSLSPDKTFELENFKDLVLYSSLYKSSDYFYRDIGTFGFQKYFGLLPVMQNNSLLGTVVIELKTKTLQVSNSFPELLIEGETKSGDEFKNYSYAFYEDGRLLSQSGKYVYNVVNNEFKVAVKQYVFKNTHSNNSSWFGSLIEYSHLVYRPSPRTLIVVSKEDNIILQGVTSLTFFFIFFLIFSLLVMISNWLWLRLRILYIENDNVQWGFKLSLDRILYKTRIQVAIIFTVVFTLILVGIITYITISTQYQAQQENTIREKLTHIADAFENGILDIDFRNIHNQSQVAFDAFANENSADLTLFDRDGVPIISTQPKLYDYGIIGKRMNGKVYVYLSKLQKSEYINEEKIGLLSYKAAYAPLRNSKNETVAYLQLPYFSNEADYRQRIGSLLNAMINIYALVFLAIGLFAVIIARQITNPLNFIQYSLSNTIYGRKNEPIKWERNDEIGALVAEYNKMIAALENSAQKLAQSERESAWREMAKQVAHEIKNPLTPLKLGLQLLEKSWRDKDPKFDLKFERFSKSFVEQIESLSSIASEFSAFAKMPDTRIERISLFAMINQAVVIFKQMDNVKILYQSPEEPFFINADRDQVLRCFNNLLKNAIEATPEDRFGIIDITYQFANKSILLRIKDNGNGIPENMREKIFEPNFTTKSSGTGLGLAFVKNSIENAGGKVWFETVIGSGTTFFLSLPAAE